RRLVARFGVEALDRTGFTTNLSLCGAFVHTNRVFKPGTVIQIEFSAKQSTASVRAVVVWAKVVPVQLARFLPSGMGVRFIDPNMKWREFYETWCGPPLAVSRAK